LRGELAAAPQAGLVEDRFETVVHGTARVVEIIDDLPSRVAARDELRNLVLAAGEPARTQDDQ
jgi:hypothetical protein